MLGIDATVVEEPFAGVQYAVYHQVNALAEKCEIKLYHQSDRFKYIPNAEHLEFSNKLTRIDWQQRKLRNETGFDTLFSPSYTCPLDMPCPMTLQVHDIIALKHPELCSLPNRVHFKVLLEKSIARADTIIVPSQLVADDLSEQLNVPANKVHVLPLALDPVFTKQSSANHFKEHGPYILFVGNIEPKKNLPLLIDAYSKSTINKTHKLLIAGRYAWKSDSVKSLIKNYSGDGEIIRLDYVDRDVMPALYANASLTVLPSLTEGFGFPIIESLSQGTPVIASDNCPKEDLKHLDYFSTDDELIEQLDNFEDESFVQDESFYEFYSWQRWAKEFLRIEI
ncbi:MAG: glycosyltransferase family 4 protein [Lentisphaeria bacterium]|nr:glycosyltransferase family 4 protein [Lentisphaeria bacterium]NQZ70607.1 glycosyltransferase family 4 protein [Lentisphaeria bacterium]